jgi:hypothetical protein
VLRARVARAASLLRRLASDPARSDDSLERELCRRYRAEIDQSLSAVLTELYGRVGRDPAPNEWRDALETLGRVVNVAGSLADSPRPPDLRQRGLGQSLRVLAARYERLTDAEIAVRVAPGTPAVSQPRGLCLHRLACAAITEAIHCRGARHVALALRPADVGLALDASDDGRDPAGGRVDGDANAPCDEGAALEWELLEAFEEAVRLGAALSFEHAAGGGARLAVRMPVDSTPLAGIARDATIVPGYRPHPVPRPGAWPPTTSARHPRPRHANAPRAIARHPRTASAEY